MTPLPAPASISPRPRPSRRWQEGRESIPLVDRIPIKSVYVQGLLGADVWWCRWSVTSLWLRFAGGAGDTEATGLQRNNFSQLLPFSDGDLLQRQQRGWGDLSGSRGLVRCRLPLGDDVVDPVNLNEDDVW
jgi:hypothetical protein